MFYGLRKDWNYPLICPIFFFKKKYKHIFLQMVIKKMNSELCNRQRDYYICEQCGTYVKRQVPIGILHYRQRECPMYGPCPENTQMSMYDTCVPLTSHPSSSTTQRLYTTPSRRWCSPPPRLPLLPPYFRVPSTLWLDDTDQEPAYSW